MDKETENMQSSEKFGGKSSLKALATRWHCLPQENIPKTAPSASLLLWGTKMISGLSRLSHFKASVARASDWKFSEHDYMPGAKLPDTKSALGSGNDFHK